MGGDEVNVEVPVKSDKFFARNRFNPEYFMLGFGTTSYDYLFDAPTDAPTDAPLGAAVTDEQLDAPVAEPKEPTLVSRRKFIGYLFGGTAYVLMSGGKISVQDPHPLPLPPAPSKEVFTVPKQTRAKLVSEGRSIEQVNASLEVLQRCIGTTSNRGRCTLAPHPTNPGELALLSATHVFGDIGDLTSQNVGVSLHNLDIYTSLIPNETLITLPSGHTDYDNTVLVSLNQEGEVMTSIKENLPELAAQIIASMRYASPEEVTNFYVNPDARGFVFNRHGELTEIKAIGRPEAGTLTAVGGVNYATPTTLSFIADPYDMTIEHFARGMSGCPVFGFDANGMVIIFGTLSTTVGYGNTSSVAGMNLIYET